MDCVRSLAPMNLASPHQTGSATGACSPPEFREILGRLVATHDAIMTDSADETSLLSVMGTSMCVILHTLSECVPGADRRGVEVAVKVNPLPAVPGPGGPAERLSNPASDYRLFECSEVLARHRAVLHAPSSKRKTGVKTSGNGGAGGRSGRSPAIVVLSGPAADASPPRLIGAAARRSDVEAASFGGRWGIIHHEPHQACPFGARRAPETRCGR